MGCGKSKHAVDTENTITKSSSKKNIPPPVAKPNVQVALPAAVINSKAEEGKGISPQPSPDIGENKPVVAAQEKKEEETKNDEGVKKVDETIESLVVSEIINNTPVDQPINSDKQKSEEEMVIDEVVTTSTSDTGHQSNLDASPAALPQIHEVGVDSHDPKKDEAVEPLVVAEIINNTSSDQAINSDKEKSVEEEVVVDEVVTTSTTSDSAHQSNLDTAPAHLPQDHEKEVDSHDPKNDEAIDEPVVVSEIVNNEALNSVEGKTEDDVVIGEMVTSTTSDDTAHKSNSEKEDISPAPLPQIPDEESGASIAKD